MTETVASEGQLVGCYTETDITDVEGLLAMEWFAGVYVVSNQCQRFEGRICIPPYGTVISQSDSL